MSRTIHAIADRVADSLARVVLGRPLPTVAVALLLVLAAASGLRHLEFSNNYRVFFSPENPELVAFEDFQATYTKNDNIQFVVKPAAGEPFDSRVASAIEQLTEEAWQIPYATRVDSVTNFQHSWADGDDLTVEDLIRDAETLSPEVLAEKKAVALAEPLLFGNLVARDAQTVGVNVTLQYPEESLLEVPAAAKHARELAQRLTEKHPDLRIAISGVSMLNNAFAESGQQDMFSLVPLMFLLMVVVMILALRSVAGTVVTFVVITLSTFGALGLGGMLGIVLSPISASAPIIILTLAIADSIHVIVTALGLLGEGRSKREALTESLRVNVLPVTLTSITTIVGFLSLNFSDSPPYWHLGNLTAMGIAFAWALSLTVLPAGLMLLPVKAVARKTSNGRIERTLDGLAGVIIARPGRVFAVGAALTVIALAFLPRIELNDEFVKYFDERVEFRRDADFAADNLNGIYLIEYSLESGEAGGINEPRYLRDLDGFTDWLREQPEVTHVFSYADVIKRLNRNLHADDPAWQRLPEDKELAAQYLLLYELSLPYGLDLNDRINIDKSATRVTATLDNVSTVETRAFLDRTDAWMAGHLQADFSAEPTGAQVMFSYISQRNVESMLAGNVFAVVIVAALIALALGSLRFGLLSILPNALPILVTFGLWGLFVGQVGMAAATVSATALGIVVDDTVHLLTKYLRARREAGLSPAEAVRYAFRTVGRAILTTTVILSLGFALLTFSTFRINSQMGLLTSIAIVVAVVMDLVFLPALLLLGSAFQGSRVMNRVLVPTGVILLIVGALLAAPAFAEPSLLTTSAEPGSPQHRGFEIAAQADRSDRGFADSRVDLEMTLRNRAGKESKRRLTISTQEVPDESLGDRSLVTFHSPADIEGTSLLSHARILDPDDQWLYLPALKRVKRISSVNKSGPFVGSEFAFEDFTSLELGKYEYEWIREEPCPEGEGLTCDVVERTPRYEHSGYSRQLSWVDSSVHQVRKVEFYDRRDELLKTLLFADYREYDGGIWRSHDFRMENLQTGKSTRLLYSDYEFRTGLGERDFDKTALRRQR
jgi:predicted RND superfamily exporter protein